MDNARYVELKRSELALYEGLLAAAEKASARSLPGARDYAAIAKNHYRQVISRLRAITG